jgi:predicted amidohydrolase
MRLTVVVAQTRVSWDLQRNLASIAAALAGTRSGEVVVLPEAAVSGYDDELSGLAGLDPDAVDAALGRVADQARERGIHLFCGSLVHERGSWRNAACYFGPDGSRHVYRKVNLASHERGRLTAGARLEVLRLPLAQGPLTVGVQLCREISFPEQWRYLAGEGAQVFAYLTHAVNPAWPAGVWRSHLVSHAAASQRFVVAANVADAAQHCPSAVISPRGEVLGELPPAQPGLLRVPIDTADCASTYLDQRREDLLRLRYGPDRAQWAHANGDMGGDARVDRGPAATPDRP